MISGAMLICMHVQNSERMHKDLGLLLGFTCIIIAYSCYLLTELSNSNGPTGNNAGHFDIQKK